MGANSQNLASDCRGLLSLQVRRVQELYSFWRLSSDPLVARGFRCLILTSSRDRIAPGDPLGSGPWVMMFLRLLKLEFLISSED